MTGPWQEIGELIDTLDAATTTGCRPWPGALPAQRRRACPGAPVAPRPVRRPITAAATWRPRPWPPTESSLAILERVVVAPAVGRFYPTELAGREAGSGTRIQLEGSDRHARASAPPLQVLDLTHYLRHRIAHTGQRSKD
jgi:hypothetical protein